MVNIPLDFVSGNIHQYSLRLRRIIVKYYPLQAGKGNEATRKCVLLKLDVCSMHVRFATQQRDTSGLINHQVKYFAKANSAVTIFLHRRHGRFIVYQFKTVSLFSNRDSKVANRMPSSSSSFSSVTSPSSATRLDSTAERSNLKSLPLLPLTAATQHHTKMMCC